MADLSQTAANVGVGSITALTRVVQVGEAVTQGQPVYRLESDGKYYQTDADDTGATKANVAGIVLTPASTDGYSTIAFPPATNANTTPSLINLGATLAVGTAYYVSATKGAICLESDLTTGDYVTLLGIAESTSLLNFRPQVSGQAKP